MMERVLFDTNIILDIALKREPHFEHSIQVSAAQFSGLDCIITRNKIDFKKSDFHVYTPDEYLSLKQR